MKKLLLVIVVLAAFGGGWWFGTRRGSAPAGAKGGGGRKILYWHDPMHPQYRSDKPGIAPDCGMRLEPVYADGGPAEKDTRPVLYYRDPHDHNYRSQAPGLNPETGNDLEPVHAGDTPGSVQVNPAQQQLMGVRYGTVELASGAIPVRAAGKVAVDETRIHRVHARYDGWIERVFADYTGRYVEKGEPLATVYSPEMLASQEEYLLARRTLIEMRHSTVNGAEQDSRLMVDAARRRLQHWNLSAGQIEQLERTGTPIRGITIHSPASGTITVRNAFPNQRISPETELYTITDLSRVWIIADVFESDAALVRLGQQATVSATSLPGRPLRARVTYIMPQVDAATRTLKVRLEAANPAMDLKPDMFADIDFSVAQGPRLVVPSEAVVDSGERKTVFVDQGGGYFEPRAVETGLRLGDRIEIRKGLKAGERIVTSGTFLLNSESQLKWPASSAATPAAAPGAAATTAKPAAPAGGAHKHD